MVLNKIIGGILIIIGFLIIFLSPDVREFQYEPISVGSVIFGIILFGVGVYLILT